MLTIYSQPDSGNCYKPRLLLAKLGKPFRHVTVSALDGSTRTPEYLARNPNGKVPLLELEDGRFLAESNAILLYLAEGTRFRRSILMSGLWSINGCFSSNIATNPISPCVAL